MQTGSAPSEQNTALKIRPTWKDLRGREARASHTAFSEAECRSENEAPGGHTVMPKTLIFDNSGKERLKQTYPLAHT